MIKPDPHCYCVIMCGGVGSRFWPYSRESRPKQFIDFFGTGRTLLQMCYDRVLPLVPKENILLSTNIQYAEYVRQQLPDIDESQILYEPARRNTAPCIAWAAHHIHAIDPQATMIVTPSDHFITREREFESAVDRAVKCAQATGALITLGVKPTSPETRYGYIQPDKQVEPGIWTVKTVTDKPSADLAMVLLDSGEFYWTSGIYVWRADAIIEAMRELAPELAAAFDKAKHVFGTPNEASYIAREFPGCPNISIDHAVMENYDRLMVEAVSFGWTDLGSWGALYDSSPKNTDRNVTQQCTVMAKDSTGNIFAVPEHKLVVVEGLHDFIVADSPDALLICPKTKERDIKQVVNDVKLRFGDKHI